MRTERPLRRTRIASKTPQHRGNSKKLLAGLAIGAGMLPLATSAAATAATQPGQFDRTKDFVTSISPSQVGSTKRPKRARLRFQIQNARAGAGARIRIFHSRPIRVSGKGLRKCKQRKLESVNPSRCPAASRIGQGTAEVIQDVAGAMTAVSFDVIAFMRSNHSVGFMFRSKARETPIDKLAVAKFKSPPNIGFGFVTFLDLPVPAFAAASSNGFTGLVGLKMSLYKRRGQRSLYTTTGCTSRGWLRFGLTMPMTITDATTGEKRLGTGRALAKAPCKG